MAPDRFIEQVLVNGLNVRYLVVGDDFRFGKNRTGTYTLLQTAGKKYDFEVTNMRSFIIDGKRVSSTLIRDALQRGDLVTAEKLLGRPYRISGRVVLGEKLGRKIGFPTANLRLGRQVSPVKGVFAARVHGLGNNPLVGVVNIGTRPTVGGTNNRLEIHLLDFKQDIYGRHVHVDLLWKLRDEERFQSIEALKQQIQQDVVTARKFFQNQRH